MLELPIAQVKPANGTGSVAAPERDSNRQASNNASDFQSEYVAQEDTDAATPRAEDSETGDAPENPDAKNSPEADAKTSDATEKVSSDTPPGDEVAQPEIAETAKKPDAPASADGTTDRKTVTVTTAREASESLPPQGSSPDKSSVDRQADTAASERAAPQSTQTAKDQTAPHAQKALLSTDADQASPNKTRPQVLTTTAENVVTSQSKESAPPLPKDAVQPALGQPISGTALPSTTPATSRAEQAAPLVKPKNDPKSKDIPRPSIEAAPTQAAPSAIQPAKTMTAAHVMQAGSAKMTLMAKTDKLKGLSAVSFEPEQSIGPDTRSGTVSQATPSGQVFARADTPTQIARQLAEAIQNRAGQSVDVALNPRELGRVRMSISAAEAGITVTVLAERPETLDLMRRNIDELAREFQNIGYESINFAFAEGNTRQHQGSPDSEAPTPVPPNITIEEIETADGGRPAQTVSSGVDLRL